MLKFSNIVHLRKAEFLQKNNLTPINVLRKINLKLQIVTKLTLPEFLPNLRKERHLDNQPPARKKEKIIW